MTVPQHRLGVKVPTDRVEWPEEGGVGEKEKNHTQTQVQSNAECQRHSSLPSSGSQWRGITAAGGQNASLSEKDMLFFIYIPRARSPGRNKALAPHWTEQTASPQHSRGTLWQLKP